MTSFYGVFLVTANLIVDVLYGFIDPRIKLAGGGKRKRKKPEVEIEIEIELEGGAADGE